ncbi:MULTISPECIES: Uma2 family endonuclease [unclassified Coleofasciculus]|uniref:Uma2 family endonuclease n=1 Tax=unclassified Coleofasciculus TaxID=2692782 RepID=UPI00187F524A|nr:MULTISPECIES: Uma2 family endonuclease [unclassified Coleofasciculus]MBE9126531.1 Uma2 family endonuclease [Coleofasciculus sp. LEGE 07081]MBE9149965.1 Uma2 family endonuclease [Coleofasciculus sp. LEGE 07092]
MSFSLLDKPNPKPIEEKIVTLHGISWKQFKTIEAQLENNRDVRLTYLSGVMEIMSPIGAEHEYVKRTLGLLLEAYMRAKGIRFYATGGFTLEAPGYASGIPDESYCIDSRKEIPDIVIEIIITSGTIDRKELFKPLRVPEVWFWKSNQLRIFQLQGDDYQEVNHSQFFPNLDKALLLLSIAHPDQYDAVNEFVEIIRQA